MKGVNENRHYEIQAAGTVKKDAAAIIFISNAAFRIPGRMARMWISIWEPHGCKRPLQTIERICDDQNLTKCGDSHPHASNRKIDLSPTLRRPSKPHSASRFTPSVEVI
jgi:hypothetical protein